MKPKELLSRAAYARRRGVAPRTIGKYVQRGIIPVHDDKIDPVECDKLLAEHFVKPLGSGRTEHTTGKRKTVNPPKKPSGTGPKVPATYVQAQANEKNLKVEILELTLALKKGEMVLTKDVEVAAFTAAREIRDKMLNIPDQISAILAAEMDEIQVRKIIMTAIESGLAGIGESYNRHKELNHGDASN